MGDPVRVKRKKSSKTIQFPQQTNAQQIPQQIIVSPEQLQAMIQTAVDSALASTLVPKKKKRYKRAATDSLYKSNGVKKASKAEPFRTTKEYNAVCDYVMNHGMERLRVRNYVLIAVGCSLGLRISDLLKLNRDLCFNSEGEIRSRIPMIDKKTGKRNNYVIVTETARKALELWDRTYGDSMYYIFFSARGDYPINETMAWRVISGAAKGAGLDGSYGTHALRKTFGYQAFNNARRAGQEGEALELLQTKYGHESQRITMRYTCISDDKIEQLAEAASASLEGKETGKTDGKTNVITNGETEGSGNNEGLEQTE